MTECGCRPRATRARRIILLGVVSLPILLLLALWIISLRSSISASRALALFEQEVHNDMPLTEVEALLGPYHFEEYRNGRTLSWSFTRESFNETHGIILSVKVWQGKVIDRGMTMSIMTGASAWRYRWSRFLSLLGL